AGARRALGLPSGGPFAAARRTGPDLARYAERYLFRAALLHRLRRIFLRTCALPARAPRMRPRRSRPRPAVCGACGLARPSVAGGRRGGVDGTASLRHLVVFPQGGLVLVRRRVRGLALHPPRRRRRLWLGWRAGAVR